MTRRSNRSVSCEENPERGEALAGTSGTGTNGGARRRRVVISIYDDFDNPYYAGGGPTVVRSIAESLAQDCEVVVVTGGRRLARSRRDGIRHLHLPVTWIGPRSGQVLWGVVLPLVALVLRYDVWIESFTPPLSSNLVPLVTRRPVIGLAQALSGRDMEQRYRTRLPLFLERLLLRYYDDVVVLNARDQEVITAANGRARVHLIPNAVPAPDVPAPDAANGSYALFLGRIDIEQKGLDLLLAAYTDAGDDSGLPPLVIAGGGRPQDEERLRELLEKAGPRVRWLGVVRGQAKEELLGGSALLVVPSREESFCLSALEALVRGRPVVHFDLPQLEWIPRSSSSTVPSFDVDALRAALVWWTSHPEERSAAGARGAAFATARHGIEGFDRYRVLVRETLAHRRRWRWARRPPVGRCD